jgi:DNA-nicking Smr family endonuclease
MDFDKMMNTWLDSEQGWNEFQKDDHSDVSSKGELRSFLKSLTPEDKIDLHGRTILEAESLLSSFIQQSRKDGLRKILIIHGKGNHSLNGPVLTGWLKRYLESSSICGETGNPEKRDGGTGATWVILK